MIIGSDTIKHKDYLLEIILNDLNRLRIETDLLSDSLKTYNCGKALRRERRRTLRSKQVMKT